MCGIVGAISERNITHQLLVGLKRLEYRGYDSAGVAILNNDGILVRQRVKGKVAKLRDIIESDPITGSTGIAHTRWATHGKPTEHNAHPHFSSDTVAVVHNGIIENHQALREKLITAGYDFQSDTDTEVIVHLVHMHLQQHSSLLLAVKAAIKELDGAYALAVLSQAHPGQVVAVRCGSPLVIGLGLKENFLASDQLALLSYTDKFIFLEEGDMALLTTEEVNCFDASGESVERQVYQTDAGYEVTEKGPYRHFMAKEIFEQADAVYQTTEGRLSAQGVMPEVFGAKASEILQQCEHVQIVACGTSYHAGLVAQRWFEQTLNLPCSVDIASEFRYRHVVVPKNSLFVCVSQSGETADTLAALEKAKSLGFMATLGICNVHESSLVRAVDLVFMTRAGREIGVASTKAFTTQLVAFLMLGSAMLRTKGFASDEHTTALQCLPEDIRAVLALDDAIKEMAHHFTDKQHALFLGRGLQFPVALEGALKLKEISYIHAEAYPAGELKHGPLALVDKDMPVIALAPNDDVLDKLLSNCHEVVARGGQLMLIADETVEPLAGSVVHIKVPKTQSLLAPIVYTLPLQLLAYHVAVLKGTDVDQPRNLAKSVTVE